MKTISNPLGRGDCFFCGADNPIGLKLTFQETETEPNELVCRWVPPAVFKGFGDVLHGGIQSGMFDEIMGWTTIHLTGQMGVTTSLQIEFLRPVFVNREIEVRCRIDSQDGKNVRLVGELTDRDGTVCSRATGNYFLMDRERFDHLVAAE